MSMRIFKYPTKVQIALDKLCGEHEGTLPEAMYSLPVMWLTEHAGFSCTHEEVKLSKKVENTEYCAKCGLALWEGTGVPKFGKTRDELKLRILKKEAENFRDVFARDGEAWRKEVSEFVEGWVEKLKTTDSVSTKMGGNKMLTRMAELAGVADWTRLVKELETLDGVRVKVLYDWLHLSSDQKFPE